MIHPNTKPAERARKAIIKAQRTLVDPKMQTSATAGASDLIKDAESALDDYNIETNSRSAFQLGITIGALRSEMARIGVYLDV